jgi:hypothetical protein
VTLICKIFNGNVSLFQTYKFLSLVKEKVKLSLCLTKVPCHEDVSCASLSTCKSIKIYGGVKLELQPLTSVLDGGEWSASCPSCSTLKEWASSTHLIGGWVALRTSLDSVKRKNHCPCWKLIPGHPAHSLVTSLSKTISIQWVCRNFKSHFKLEFKVNIFIC